MAAQFVYRIQRGQELDARSRPNINAIGTTVKKSLNFQTAKNCLQEQPQSFKMGMLFCNTSVNQVKALNQMVQHKQQGPITD